jgi:hypothetical protein
MSFVLVKVGRAKDNDIVLTHASVSRYHCELFYDAEGNVFLTDKNSANGTFVNGRRIFGSVQLEPNDIVKPGLDVPLRWRNFNSFKETGRSNGSLMDGTQVDEPVLPGRNQIEQKKINSPLKTVLITLSIIAFVVGLWFVLNEFVLGDGKPPVVDQNKPNDTSNQPDKTKKENHITYDFSCLNDENDLGTTEVIDILEKVDHEITNTFGGEISIEEEEKVGSQLLKDCRKEYKFIESGTRIQNLRAILKRLIDQIMQPKGFHYQIFLIESDELNAFTAGAKIFVTTKMYRFCKTNDELACVIGHEINHNELGHIKEHLQKERLLTAEGAALAQLATISFGQKKEIHCDMTGIDLAIAAGYNGCVNIELWKRMHKEFEEGEYNALENIMRSHPYSEKRAKCSHDHILNNYEFVCNTFDEE